ncbi:DegT/DnrJ/EryC1/StrS family aminotransferase [Microvirga guangxiensis]|uniref:Perosamine synthetase n=1 Tax=Microvirga guangxiensis TaxID=549386 RepID=A0A1G5LQH8_9HYPH|nr:DegT/DnrJ/EryC1/StrS family aminotransferase [Microvirga guangxiensis]SCZ14490.1 perosamine synthetase [Microvirga guangxiensis]
MHDFIPVYSPQLTGGEWDNVKECLDTTWISSRGRFVEEFEQQFASYVGTAHAISVCNGTVALHLALAGLGIGPGDKVAVQTFTYVASVNAVRYVGAEPVFIDSDPVTLQMCPQDLSRKVASGDVRAVIVAHLYGQAANMGEIASVAQRHGMLVVEDCAEAFGTRIGNRHVGIDSEVATYSFFGNKTITTGEGGMVTTDDATVAQLLRKLRGQGLAGEREYWHDVVGFNFRMTNICAAIGTAQLARADEVIERKRKIAEYYRQAIKGTPLEFHHEQPGTTHSFWMCSVLAKSAQERDTLRDYLKSCGIDTRPFFYPVHSMPMYQEWDHGPYPGADNVAYRGLNLPSFPALNDHQLDRISTAIHQFYRG